MPSAWRHGIPDNGCKYKQKDRQTREHRDEQTYGWRDEQTNGETQGRMDWQREMDEGPGWRNRQGDRRTVRRRDSLVSCSAGSSSIILSVGQSEPSCVLFRRRWCERNVPSIVNVFLQAICVWPPARSTVHRSHNISRNIGAGAAAGAVASVDMVHLIGSNVMPGTKWQAQAGGQRDEQRGATKGHRAGTLISTTNATDAETERQDPDSNISRGYLNTNNAQAGQSEPMTTTTMNYRQPFSNSTLSTLKSSCSVAMHGSSQILWFSVGRYAAIRSLCRLLDEWCSECLPVGHSCFAFPADITGILTTLVFDMIRHEKCDSCSNQQEYRAPLTNNEEALRIYLHRIYV